MTTPEILSLEKSSHMQAYKRFDVALVSGSGAVTKDAEDREYIDFGAGIGVNALGYCDKGWSEAVSKQAATLQHISNLYYSSVQADLAEKLTALCGMDRVFFGNSGAEANECAIKLARKYSADQYGAGRSTILTLTNSFHGRTVTTLSATGQDHFHQFFDPFTPGFVHVEAGDIEALDKAMDGSVCAVMIELVQGEGGVVPQSRAYVDAVAKRCKEQDILLIVDEVQTGVGRTGSFLACEQYAVKPDIVTLAKGLGGGLPIGACLCTAALAGVMGFGTHGSTFGGNPVACAGALYTIEKIGTPAFSGMVVQTADYLRGQLEAIPQVKQVRGLGLMLGCELNDGIAAADIAAACIQEGLLILTAKTALRLLPPLTITKDEINRGLTILRGSLEKAV